MELNWIFCIVAFILIYFSVKGFQKGFLKVVFSLLSIILTLTIVSVITPYVSSFLMENTTWYEQIRTKCVTAVTSSMEERTQASIENQQMALNQSGVSLPENAQNRLLKSTEDAVNSMLESSGIYETLGETLANLLFRMIVFLIAFLIVFLCIRFLFHFLNMVAKLPLIRTVNRGAGLVAGFVQGLVVVWIAFLFISVISSSEIGTIAVQAIRENTFTAALYDSNLILYMIMGFL